MPVASTKVEEERVEASITDVWRISQQLTLESGFNYEASTISQTVSQPPSPDIERDFTYSKPRAVLSWAPNATDQWRFSVVRDVSQLDFGDFATGLNSISTEANVGNPNLEPEQTWKASAQWKRPIGQRGSISLTGFYDDIEDTQDFIPVIAPCAPPAGGDAVSAPRSAISAMASAGAGASRRRFSSTTSASRTAFSSSTSARRRAGSSIR